MARPFTVEEKREIKIKLKEVSTNLFKEQGFKKTRIEDITKKTGISLGGFYTFYQNKEELLFEIIDDIENKLYQKLLELMSDDNITPQVFLKKALSIICQGMNHNKIFWNEDSDILSLINKESEEKKKQGYDEDIEFIKKAILVWYKKGYVIDTPPEKILGIFRCATTLCSNRDMIGSKVFEELYNNIIDGLIKRYI